MTKHTKGPWTISDDHGRRHIETIKGNDDVICEISRRDYGVKGQRVGVQNDEEFQANSRLIKACPCMFEIIHELSLNGLTSSLMSRTKELVKQIEG